MYVRDYATAGANRRNFLAGPRPAWPLGVRRDVVIEPSDAPFVRVELDLAVKLEGSMVAAVVPLPALLELGLRPALSPVIVTAEDRLAPLQLLVMPPANEPITLAAGTVVAQLLLLNYEATRLVPDPDLDYEMHEAGSGVLDTDELASPEPRGGIEF